MLGFTTIVNTIGFLLVFSAGIKFNEKWPAAASKVAFVWNAVEAVAKWAYKLSGLGSTAAK